MQRGEAEYRPHHAHSVWYRFQVKREVLVDVSVCGVTFDWATSASEIAVYAGRSLDSLRQVRWSDNLCEEGFGVAFRARRGRTYAIAVFSTPDTTLRNGARLRNGRFRLRVRPIPRPDNDDFADARPLRLGSTVFGTTAGGTGERGEPRRCCGVPHTVWYRLRVATEGHVRLNACRGSTRIAVYTGDRVNRLIRSAYYGACLVQFAAQPGVSYRVVVDDRRRWGRFRLSARTATPPPNDDFANATPITLGSTISATTRDATPEAGEPSNGGVFTVWFRLPIAEASAIELTLANNDPKPAVAACEWRTPTVRVYRGDELSQLEYITANEGCFLDTNALRIPFNGLPGVYRIWVAGLNGEGDFTLTATAVAAPP